MQITNKSILITETDMYLITRLSHTLDNCVLINVNNNQHHHYSIEAIEDAVARHRWKVCAPSNPFRKVIGGI